jgi:site-specific DNA-methyltransferase (adenine-specific)
VDSVVTDPPYGLSFMNKKWDYDVPSVEFWQEVYRVLKPGGHILSFGGTRTYHRMVVNIEDAGFEIRDQIMWLYGSGFPKSLNIGKAVDKLQGNDREVIPSTRHSGTIHNSPYHSKGITNEIPTNTKGSSEFEGWGTALKPANEPICVARKPLSEKTVAENVLKWGTGGINIDGCRVGLLDGENTGRNNKEGDNGWKNSSGGKSGNKLREDEGLELLGRFPANIILDEIAGEMLDEQSGGHNDKGGASRFFYQAKVSKAERNMGLDGFEDKTSQLNSGGIGRKTSVEKRLDDNGENAPTTKNTHPTVKPINLMTYLCRLITPPNGIVLDPFMGSGSTGISARLEGFKFIGMEMDEDYFKIAEARIDNYEEYRKFLK